MCIVQTGHIGPFLILQLQTHGWIACTNGDNVSSSLWIDNFGELKKVKNS